MFEPFNPVFDFTVTGLAQNGLTYGVRSMYCLTEKSASELADRLKDLDPQIVQANPVPDIGNRFTYSSKVPFFVFPDGKVRNAGVLATYFVWFHGSQADEACRADIADPYTGTELL